VEFHWRCRKLQGSSFSPAKNQLRHTPSLAFD
jgi:hypothetical protein